MASRPAELRPSKSVRQPTADGLTASAAATAITAIKNATKGERHTNGSGRPPGGPIIWET